MFLQEFNKALSVLRKMLAVIQEHDDLLSKAAYIELQISKSNKKGNSVDSLLDNLNEVKTEIRILNELSHQFFGKETEELRLEVMKRRAVLSKYEESLNDYTVLKEYYEIVKTSGLFEDSNSKEVQSQYLHDLNTAEQLLQVSTDRIREFLTKETI